MDAVDAAIVLFGVAGTVLIYVYIGRDATRNDVSRSQLWAAIAAVPFLLGVGLYLFASVPTTGVIMTANTGLVLYTFEREIANEDEEPAEPGELPPGPNVGSSSEEHTE
ncbi:uncharacterized protein Nmag_0939 [Natrialba magadii ATCC 43099]|uniref:Uncharacterized protein n=1 Tax=Natrialba magadii (strain ATCC 43099 / DSM 3394 / CCM 3739 / CIP 104546 / IAM 13178 / JCM 8861 / NBRC 102185 / NCIMB 2190 / MS3) TaxID=547559 RepID=D3SQN5_NATMM|nr:hypothetical protein [Natrialba magadii]ADD04523.1 uncharacterized protein Nmag_0939 [Natrialba magadii ATCC 43099]ELY25180.1 hypothetical protein C500_17221 [Natrialba magadii ATCC 43099]